MVRIAGAGKWCAGPLWVDGMLEAVCCHHCCGYAGELKLAGRPWLSFCCSDIAEVICPRSLREQVWEKWIGPGELGMMLLPWNHTEKYHFPSAVGIIKCFASARSWNYRQPLWRDWVIEAWCHKVVITWSGTNLYRWLYFILAQHLCQNTAGLLKLKWLNEELIPRTAVCLALCTPRARPNAQGSVPRSTAAHWEQHSPAGASWNMCGWGFASSKGGKWWLQKLMCSNFHNCSEVIQSEWAF